MNATRTPWAVTALMALGTFTAMFALSTLIEGGGWLRTVFFVLVVCVAADLAVRAASRSRVLPTLAALGAAVIVMVPLFAVDEDGGRHLLPTPSALGDLWRAFSEGARYAADTPAPAEATTALISLVTVFAVAIFVVADHLAASWRAVAVSGIVLMLPWTPAIFLQYRVPMWALFATAACWMLAMGAARSAMVTHRSAAPSGAVIATCCALLATLLVVPAALGGNGWGMIPRFNAPSALDSSTRLNLALDLRKSLTVNSAATVLTYTSTGQHPGTLRLYTFIDFDGSSWERAKGGPPTSEPVNDQLLWPSPVDGWADADHVMLNIDSSQLAERNLPIPTVPRTVSAGDGWQYTQDWDEVYTEGKGTKGLQYTVVADLGYFTAASLEEAQSRIDRGENQIDPAYTAVASSIDLPRITALAQSITTDATSQYQQAVAIQDYLRDSSNFTYDTSVSPGGTGDSVSQFLDDRSGYCVQFATTMVMLARSLDIPARLAMGFLGGRLTDDGTWEVRGADAHAWPELYFPGQGWVRFEPTPAVQTGNPPSYADSSLPQTPQFPGNVPVPTAIPSAPAQTSNPLPTTPASEPEADGGISLWAVALAVVLLAALAGAAWLLRRRSAARAAAHGPEAAWSALREQLPSGLQWPLTLTPLEAAQRLEHDTAANGAPLTSAASEALATLRDAVSDERYAPMGSDAQEEQLLAAVETVVTEANEGLRSRPDRVGAQSAPQHDS